MKCNTPKRLTKRERRQLAKVVQEGFNAYIKATHNIDLHDWQLLDEDERTAIVDEYKSKYGEFKPF